MTLEIDLHALRSPSSASRSTKTGIKVAEAMPPSTRSNNIFGMVLARLNESAMGEKPSTHASTSTRNRPVRRETNVPPAIDSVRELCDEDSLIVRDALLTCDGRCVSTKRRERVATRR